MKNARVQGFTLIELLIVIAIIGLLSAVLIPNLLTARNRSVDTAAQVYLREAMTIQEIYWVDHRTYTNTLSDLNTLGLKSQPSGVNFNIVAKSDTGYCMTSTRTNGSGKTFHATLGGGLTNSQLAPVCTAAN
jgi:type IV pilus assembly protein PilA